MRWGAVLAGTVFAIGLWALLQTIGMGIGLAAVDTDDAGNLRGIGIGTGVWTLVAPLIAMFFGAMLAGRLANTREASVGAMHGGVLWALTSAVGLWATISIVTMVASGVTRAGGAALGAGSSAVSGALGAGTSADPLSALGIDEQDLLGPINERLQQQGKPRITADGLRATLRSSAQRAVREGRFDRSLFEQELARNTALTRDDVRELSQQISDRYDSAMGQARDQIGEIGGKAQTAALTAADATGKALLWGGLMFLLALGAAAGGGALGARISSRRDDDDRTRGAVAAVPVVPTPVVTRNPDDRFITP
ncbi:MAG: hypothetical protein H0T89_33055 [Deltaproteobacteria bacterium]|nr:hypothetical protein [Deltaproteobacteria bacterium]MDQ3300942.1 hypothetical protein [Myxococcota bacterium]